jgi:hypothetical protein
MAEYDPSEFLALCASILDDGEVSADEAYQLADWLNKHDEACEQWPGRELVEPLQKIWADGSPNQRELHRLARLLISVQREWARHPHTDIVVASGHSHVAATQWKLNNFRLPSVAATFRVPSQTVPGRLYEVDLTGPSCTCPDWRARRSKLPIGDLTRCCKHILSVYARTARPEKTDACLMAFIENGWPAHPRARWQLMTAGSHEVLFCSAAEQGWANVYAKSGAEYCRFGFNVEEQRWAYGEKPESAREIANAIVAFESGDLTEFAREEANQIPDLQSVRPASARQSSRDINSSHSKRAVFVSLAVVLGIIIVVGGRVLNSDRRSAIPASIPQDTAISESPPIQRESIAPPPQPGWTAITTRQIRASAPRGKVVIPKGTKLKVIARSNDDVMVWYDGITVTVPAASTDLK